MKKGHKLISALLALTLFFGAVTPITTDYKESDAAGVVVSPIADYHFYPENPGTSIAGYDSSSTNYHNLYTIGSPVGTGTDSTHGTITFDGNSALATASLDATNHTANPFRMYADSDLTIGFNFSISERPTSWAFPLAFFYKDEQKVPEGFVSFIINPGDGGVSHLMFIDSTHFPEQGWWAPVIVYDIQPGTTYNLFVSINKTGNTKIYVNGNTTPVYDKASFNNYTMSGSDWSALSLGGLANTAGSYNLGSGMRYGCKCSFQNFLIYKGAYDGNAANEFYTKGYLTDYPLTVGGQLYADNMVIQRDKELKIKGTAKPGSNVTVNFNGQNKTATTNSNGDYVVTLNAMSANATGQNFTVSTDYGKSVTYSNVVVGEVFIGMGQSNMAYATFEFTYAEYLIKNNIGGTFPACDVNKYNNMATIADHYSSFAHFDKLRFYYQNILPEGMDTRIVANQWRSFANWADLTSTENNTGNISYSALCFSIAMYDLIQVPIGFATCAVGGSRIREWITPSMVAKYGDTGRFYNNMTLPMGNFNAKALLWYQGESDVFYTNDYKEIFVEMLGVWREQFNDANLPTLVYGLVQFNPDPIGPWYPMREIQQQIANENDNVYLVNGIDTGDYSNIHPTDKWVIHQRAVGILRKNVYNMSAPSSGYYGDSPVLESATRVGDVVTLKFKNATTLSYGDTNHIPFYVSDDKSNYTEIQPTSVNGNQITFNTSKKYISYLQSDCFLSGDSYLKGFLYNEYGLPVNPISNAEIVQEKFVITVTSNNSDYGTVSTAEIKAKAGDTIVVNNDSFTLNGNVVTATPNSATAQYTYAFSSWSIPSLTVTGDMTITANFTRSVNKYTVSFDMKGHGTQISSQSIDYNSVANKPDDPVATGYTFKGWFKETGCVNAWNFASDKVTGNVTLYAKWEATDYTIEYTLDGGSLVGTNPTSYNIETNDITLINPTKTNYNFIGWTGTGLSEPTMNVTIAKGSTGDRSYVANWSVKTGISYKVEHYQQNLGDDNYTLVDTDNLSGNAGAETSAVAKSYTGFTVQPFSQSTINEDGSTVVKIYYNRNTYTITLHNNNDTADTVLNNIKYGTSAAALYDEELIPSKVGYTFDAWYLGEVKITSDMVVESDLTLDAKYHPNTDTAYKVEHYQQNINDDNYTLKDTDNLTGTTGELTAAEAKDYTGFTAGTVTQVAIAADGSTVVKIYYIRDTFDVDFDLKGKSGSVDSQTIRYEGLVSEPENPTADGYAFIGWYEDEACLEEYDFSSKVTKDLTLYAKWEATDYTIEYTLDGGSLVGTNPTSYNIETNDITLINPTKTNYNFIGWTGTGLSEPTMNVTIAKGSTGDRSYVANWSVKTGISYKVEHYQQNLGDDNYTLVDTDNLSGNAGAETSAVAKSYTGFTVQPFSQSTINEDGSTVVKIYYNRNMIEISFKNYDGTVLDTQSVKYGITPSYSGETPIKPGTEQYTYSFSGWDPTLGPASEPVDYIAQYEEIVNTFTVTIIVNESDYGDVSVSTVNDVPYGSIVAVNGNIITINGTEIKANAKTNSAQYSYSFVSWSNTDGGIVEDRNITANFSRTTNSYKVSYNVNGHGTAPAGVTLEYGSKVNKPTDPTSDGYIFKGWFKEAACENAWNFDVDTVLGDITLFAKWEEEPVVLHTVTVNPSVNGSVSVDKAIVEHGDRVTLTITPEKDCKLSKIFINGEDMTADVENNELTIMVTNDIEVDATFQTVKGGCALNVSTTAVSSIAIVSSLLALLIIEKKRLNKSHK